MLCADGHRHRSPNAGRPEAAMAGALGVRLGGRNHYAGVAREGAFLGADLPAPTVGAARQAAALVGLSSLIFAALIGAALGGLESFGTGPA